jgi:hypothetical protein
MERDSELSNQPSPPTPLPRLGEGSFIPPVQKKAKHPLVSPFLRKQPDNVISTATHQ